MLKMYRTECDLVVAESPEEAQAILTGVVGGIEELPPDKVLLLSLSEGAEAKTVAEWLSVQTYSGYLACMEMVK